MLEHCYRIFATLFYFSLFSKIDFLLARNLLATCETIIDSNLMQRVFYLGSRIWQHFDPALIT